MLFTLSAQTFGPDSVWTEHWRLRLWFRSHLSPQQLPHADENAPQPLVNCESRAGERLPSELNDDDLRRRRNTQVQQRADPNVLSDPSCSSVPQSSIKSTSMSLTLLHWETSSSITIANTLIYSDSILRRLEKVTCRAKVPSTTLQKMGFL